MSHPLPPASSRLGDDSDQRALARVAGTVAYRERVALLPDAVITVRLVDVSRLDVPAQVIAEQQIAPGGKQPPVDFELDYDAHKIRDQGMYSVQAQIEVDGQLAFISTDEYHVITQGNPMHVKILVHTVSRVE